MKKYSLIFAILMLVFSGASQAQRKTAGKAKPAQRLTAEGVLYFVGSGNRITECVLKTANGAIAFSVVGNTKRQGFNPNADNDPAWNLGAKWRVVYHGEGKDSGFTADSVTYLGKIESIANAQQTAYDYLNLLADEKYREAYTLLSPEAKTNLNFNEFTKMYTGVSIDMRGRIICSHTDDSVQLLLAPHGSDGGDLFQLAEIGLADDGKWLIKSLGVFQDSTAGCALTTD